MYSHNSKTIEGVMIAISFKIEQGKLMKYLGTDTDVVIPNNVTSIGSGAFSDCTNLTIFSTPDSVTGIDKYAFDGCDFRIEK